MAKTRQDRSHIATLVDRAILPLVGYNLSLAPQVDHNDRLLPRLYVVISPPPNTSPVGAPQPCALCRTNHADILF